MAIFGELVPSWLYSQLQVIDPISGVHTEHIYLQIFRLHFTDTMQTSWIFRQPTLSY